MVARGKRDVNTARDRNPIFRRQRPLGAGASAAQGSKGFLGQEKRVSKGWAKWNNGILLYN